MQRIDHHRLANTAFKTKLKKNKKLSGNASVQAALSSEIAFNYLEHVDPASPEDKIRSRLLSSKILAQEVAETVRDLANMLQPESEPVTQGDGVVEERSRKKRKISVEDNDNRSAEEDGGDDNIEEGRDDTDHGEHDPFEWGSGDDDGGKSKYFTSSPRCELFSRPR
jgi:BUD22